MVRVVECILTPLDWAEKIELDQPPSSALKTVRCAIAFRRMQVDPPKLDLATSTFGLQLQKDRIMRAIAPVGNAIVLLKISEATEFSKLGVKPRSQFVNTTRHLVEEVSKNMSMVVTEHIEVTVWQS